MTQSYNSVDRFLLLDQRTVAWMDGLRAIAILLVLMRHSLDGIFIVLYGENAAQNMDVLRLAASFGWIGVHLFFIISGFLVGGHVVLSVRAGRFRWWRFAAARAIRILPPALIFLVAVKIFWKGGMPAVPEIVHNLLLVSNYWVDFWLPHYWSLCVEEHFYVLLPLVCLLGTRFIRSWPMKRTAIALFVASIVFAAYRLVFAEVEPKDINTQITFFLFSHWQIDFFLFGIALRLSCEATPPRMPDASTRWGSAIWLALLAGIVYVAIAAGVAALDGNSPLQNQHRMGPALAGALVIAGGFAWMVRSGPPALRLMLSARPLRRIAALSYSLYLVHPTVFEAGAPIWRALTVPLANFPGVGFAVIVVTSTLAALAAAAALYVVVERPALLLRRWVGRS